MDVDRAIEIKHREDSVTVVISCKSLGASTGHEFNLQCHASDVGKG